MGEEAPSKQKDDLEVSEDSKKIGDGENHHKKQPSSCEQHQQSSYVKRVWKGVRQSTGGEGRKDFPIIKECLPWNFGPELCTIKVED